MKTNKKLLAVLMLALMMAVCLVPFTEGQADADDTPTFKSLYPGSWTWDSTTGYGPFNSFYAAFDMNDGNKFVSILDPNDLSKRIDGTSLGSGYNIMWVLPTVYWSVDQNGDLTITNDSTAGGTAYAHTIDGHVYAYVAYAVHEAGTATVGGSTVITSEPNVTPAGNQTRATFRTYAHNYTMDSSLATDSTNHPAYSMLWNFYQWELYKYCCFAVMEDFNAQNTVGNGHVFRTESSFVATTTGATDSMGPYAGNPGLILTNDSNASAQAYGLNSVKLFIENAWGGSYEWVDGIVYNNGSAAINTNHTPDDTSTSGANITTVSYTFPSGYPNTISTDAQTWGMGTNTAGSATVGLTDYSYGSTSSNRVLYVGGYAHSVASGALRYGLSYASANFVATDQHADVGSRLAFVYDAGPASAVSTPYSYTIDYDSSAMSSGSAAISVANMSPVTHSEPSYTATIVSNDTDYGTVSTSSVANITSGTVATVSDNVLTIGSNSITATKTTPNTAQYTYGFDGWYVNNSKITASYTITGDVTIEARFTATVNNYNVTIQSNNTDYGTVNVGSIPNTPYGSVIHLSGTNDNILTLNGTVVTATVNDPDAYYTYGFDGYQTDGQVIQDGDIITGARTIVAHFSATNIYTVIIQPNQAGWGSVSVDQVIGVPSGNTITIDGASLTVNGVTSEATASDNTDQYTYAFSGWSVANNTAVTDNMTVYANFTRTINTYNVTIQSNNTDYGTVSGSSILAVEYGTPININGNNIEISGTTITATPTTATDEYYYAFESWTVPGSTIVGTTSITANFTRSEFVTLTFAVNNGSYGSVSPSTLSVPAGSVITVSGSTLSVFGTTVTATAAGDDYRLTGWSVPNNYVVTGAMTITASFSAPTNTNQTLLDLVPLFAVLMILMSVATVGLRLYQGDYSLNMVAYFVGITVAVIVVCTLLIPAVGGS